MKKTTDLYMYILEVKILVHCIGLYIMQQYFFVLTHFSEILTKCQKLRSLDLRGCRGLPWNMRRVYAGDEIHELAPQLQSLLEGGQPLPQDPSNGKDS